MAAGLSDTSLSTRTCLQHLPTVYSPETLVLCPPHPPHALTHLSTYHGARDDRESRRRQLIIVWRRRRGSRPERSTWPGGSEPQSRSVRNRNRRRRNHRQRWRSSFHPPHKDAAYCRRPLRSRSVRYSFTHCWQTVRRNASAVDAHRHSHGSIRGVLRQGKSFHQPWDT